MARKTPKHMTRQAFNRFILECAIRDRVTYIDAITPDFPQFLSKEDRDKLHDETAEVEAEVAAMKNRLSAIPS